jgi:hypothetical protein
MIEKCLMHLENNYFSQKGNKIIESIAERVINGESLDPAFEVVSLINSTICKI